MNYKINSAKVMGILGILGFISSAFPQAYAEQGAVNTGQDTTQMKQDTTTQMKKESGNWSATKTGKGPMASAKDELAPHALMLDTSLQNSLVVVKGLQAQEKGVPNPVSKESMQHAQIYKTMLNHDLDTAMTHAQELQGAIKKYPDMAKSDSYQNLQGSINDLNASRQMWMANLDKESYLQDKNRVNADLDKLQKQLKDTLDKVSTFSKDQLRVEPAFA